MFQVNNANSGCKKHQNNIKIILNFIKHTEKLIGKDWFITSFSGFKR